ncbi:hypothetical protein ACLO87_09500 [Paenalcaligenes sp. Me52]|uniref:hypothetical protein n=1 Tax=Paenalcaligenes sp. Me52 TaxID=3392038 RepID=UPI003D2B3AE7
MDPMAIFTGITHGISAYKTAVETLDEAKVTAATNELHIQLMHIGAEVIAMQNKSLESTEREATALARIRELEDQVRKLEKRNRDFSRYDLVEDYPGTFTLRIKESARNGEPVHHLCPSCRDNKSVKSILQITAKNNEIAQCPTCKTEFRLAPPWMPSL